MPVTTWEAMANPPSAMGVQAGPRLPSGRLKSSVTTPAQLTATLVTLAVPMVPLAFETVHSCPEGLVLTETV